MKSLFSYSTNRHVWLNRDPIQEGGGINLYRFAANTPINRIDAFGECPALLALPLLLEAAPAITFTTPQIIILGGLFGVLIAPEASPSRFSPALPGNSLINAPPTTVFAPNPVNTMLVDPNGNVIPVNPGETITVSPDGKWIQVRDPSGRPTGVRLDGGHKPTTHDDPRARSPHAHVPEVTNPDGTPWLPVNQPVAE